VRPPAYGSDEWVNALCRLGVKDTDCVGDLPWPALVDQAVTSLGTVATVQELPGGPLPSLDGLVAYLAAHGWSLAACKAPEAAAAAEVGPWALDLTYTTLAVRLGLANPPSKWLASGTPTLLRCFSYERLWIGADNMHRAIRMYVGAAVVAGQTERWAFLAAILTKIAHQPGWLPDKAA
jgi:hypothetical protein